jgi:energy-coupling factor transporter transmembrane protein EcfT
MTPPRRLLLGGMLAISLVLAFFLRDAVYASVIVPFAYLLWLGKYYYSAIPQLFLWAIFLSILFVTVLWNFLPAARVSQRKPVKRRSAEGEVEALAAWIRKSSKGNYFKWQLANRLGKIAHRLAETSGQEAGRATNMGPSNDGVEKYLDAGINYSFVDFPGPKNRFHHPPPTILDLDPKEAVEYLESQLELRRGRHP